MSVLVVAGSLLTAMTARGDTFPPPSPPPGWEEVWPQLSQEEKAGIAEILDSTPLDPDAIAQEMEGVPEGPTQDELEEVAAAGSAGLAEGIFEHSQSPFSGRMHVVNQWVRLNADGSKLRAVYAGRSREDPARGVLVVQEYPWPQPPDLEYPVAETVQTYEGPDGPYRIVAEESDTLRVGTAGAPLILNLDRRVLDHPPDCGSVIPSPALTQEHDHSLRLVAWPARRTRTAMRWC